MSSDLVIVAAPFDTPGVAGVEELVRRYALVALGTEQPQLDEHRDNGLPDLDDTVAALVAAGLEAVTVGDGHLWDWLLVMVLRFQLESRPALGPLAAGYDVLYNASLSGRSLVPPYYRHLVVARAGGAPAVGDRTVPDDLPPDFAAVAAALIAADSTEVSRQDTVPRLDRLQYDMGDVTNRLVRLEERIDALTELVEGVSAQVLAVKAKLARLVHPFRRG